MTAVACHILYSTQSGRAKACARRTSRILSEKSSIQLQNGKGTSFDNVNFIEAAKSGALLILFVSTTGDGDHAQNIKETWKKLLQKSLARDLLLGTRFCIFCLGDRAYGPQKFCAAGRKLTVRLRQLGATLVFDPGYGDDGTPNGGVFYDLDAWIQTALIPYFGMLETPAVPDSFASVDPPYRVAFAQQDAVQDELNLYSESYRKFFQKQSPLAAYCYDENLKRVPGTVGQSFPLIGVVSENRRITADNWVQNTRHIRINIDSASAPMVADLSNWSLDSLPYRAGDVASILPCNSERQVVKFLAVLPLRLREIADCELSIECMTDDAFPGVGYTNWPKKCTLRGWLTYCADIHALPEREDLRALGKFCCQRHGKEQRDKLMSLSETKDSSLFADYVLREKRSWADVLYDFDALRNDHSLLSLEALLGLLPPIRPRDFSICSSPTAEWAAERSKVPQNGFGLELCVAVVEGTTRLGRNFYGLCSHYLGSDDSGVGCCVRIWIRPGSFHGLPLDSAPSDKVPILFVGAGTGVAPLRSMIHERLAVAKIRGHARAAANGDEFDNENILVFGCRKKADDYYYKREWFDLQQSRRLGLITAFSRDQWHKIYVQQVLGSAGYQTALVRHILEKNGAIYIAGGPRMARAVKETIVECLTRELNGDEKKAMQILTKLQRMGRYGVEAWS